MVPALPVAHERLAIEAELPAGSCRFVRERLRLPMGIEASFGWLRHPPTVLVVPQCADRQLLLLRRYHPAVGRWLLEFPSGVLLAGESPAEAGARLVRQLTGHGGGTWRGLGVLRPNPGYTDEHMTVGWMAVEGTVGSNQELVGGGLEDPAVAGPYALQLCSPQALEATLSDLEEPVDGRCVSAWFLARHHGSV